MGHTAEECKCLGAVIGWFISGVIAVVVIAISMHTVIDKKASSPVPYYTPADTMRFSLPASSYFCKSLTLRDDSDSNVSATVFMLKKKPPLSGLNEFSLSVDQSIKPGDYYYLMYYLYPSANLTLHACVVSQPSDFYVIQGERNFNAWKDNPNGSYWEEHLRISKTCPEDAVQSFNFTSRANEYYFAFYNWGSNSSTVRATLYFERPEYITANHTIVKQCQAGGMVNSSSCKVDIPLIFNYYMLLIVDYPTDGNWTTKVKVDWSCNLRTWLCVVQLVLITLVFLLPLACCCMFVLGLAWKDRHRHTYEPLN